MKTFITSFFQIFFVAINTFLISKPLSSVGLNQNVLKQLCNALPNNISGYEFIFTAQNKAVLVKSIDENNKTTAIIMPLMLSKKD